MFLKERTFQAGKIVARAQQKYHIFSWLLFKKKNKIKWRSRRRRRSQNFLDLFIHLVTLSLILCYRLFIYSCRSLKCESVCVRLSFVLCAAECLIFSFLTKSNILLSLTGHIKAGVCVCACVLVFV